jgi:predicted GNAT family acetyltransferase
MPKTCLEHPMDRALTSSRIDESHRKYGIGLALICHAIEAMKQRGIEGVFVDWGMPKTCLEHPMDRALTSSRPAGLGSRTLSSHYPAWAFPQTCGPNTGLIGAVGIDESHRKYGIGLALICHAKPAHTTRRVQPSLRRRLQCLVASWLQSRDRLMPTEATDPENFEYSKSPLLLCLLLRA